MLPVRPRPPVEHCPDHRKSQRQPPALPDQVLSFGRQGIHVHPGPAGQNVAGLLRRQQVRDLLLRAQGRGNGGVAGGKKKARTGGLGAERLDVARAPDIVHHNQSGLLPYSRAVAVDRGQLRVVAGDVIFESLSHLAQAGHEVVGGLLARGHPDDAVGGGSSWPPGAGECRCPVEPAAE